jgi:hypothetical protein
MITSHVQTRRRRCHVLGALLAVAATLVTAPAAFADTATLTVTTPGGQPDPVAGVGRVFTVSGNAAVSEELFVAHRPAGGAACAPSYNSDSGEGLGSFNWQSVNGNFSFQTAITWSSPGTELFCIWLAQSSSSVSTPISQVITFRSPTGTISATVGPAVPRPDQDTQITVTGASEAPREVFAKVRAAGGAPCAPTYDSDSGDSVLYEDDVNGAFTLTATTRQANPGHYLICLWLASSSRDAAPIAGPQAVAFDVVQPPPRVASTSVLNCSNGRRSRPVHARTTPGVCLRYRFSTPPLAGQKLTVTFLTPAHRTYKRVATAWPDQTSPQLVVGSLAHRAYRHRRGIWQAVLRVAGTQLATTSFRVA